MFDTIAGLPLHPLVVHAVEVIVPLAAVVLLLAAAWPRFRRWAYLLPLLLGLAALVLVPVATQSGQALAERVGETPLVRTHTQMGESLTPWVIALAVVCAVLVWWTWSERRTAMQGPGAQVRGETRARGLDRYAMRAPRWLAAVLLVASLVVSGGTLVQAIRIGHSGATAVWGQIGSAPSEGGEGGGDGDSDGD